jgi:hypothetical protein
MTRTDTTWMRWWCFLGLVLVLVVLAGRFLISQAIIDAARKKFEDGTDAAPESEKPPTMK